MKCLIIIFLITVFNLIAPSQTVRRTIQISADLQLVQITDHVWAHVSVAEMAGFGKVSSNGLVYIQKRKAFLFDTPVNDIQTEALVKAVADSLKSKIVGFVPNHWHQDCIGGLKYLQSMKIKSYANQLTIEEAKKHNLPVPTQGFNETLKLKLSGKTIECWYPGGGHTKDNIVVWLPSEKVLFAGCMAKEMKSNSPGNLSDANVKSWPSTIKKVIAKYNDAQFVVPGHGQWGGPELLSHTFDLVSNIR